MRSLLYDLRRAFCTMRRHALQLQSDRQSCDMGVATDLNLLRGTGSFGGR